jgi:hypothetical protein
LARDVVHRNKQKAFMRGLQGELDSLKSLWVSGTCLEVENALNNYDFVDEPGTVINDPGVFSCRYMDWGIRSRRW